MAEANMESPEHYETEQEQQLTRKDDDAAHSPQMTRVNSAEIAGPMMDQDEDSRGALNTNYRERVRPLIDLIDRLRAIGLDKDLGLPSIVVVGDQSTGKSSVLEAISGIQLPRGTDIVTRCPLELRLKKSGLGWKAQIGYIVDKEHQLSDIPSPEDIEARVRSAQNELTGGTSSVSDSLITLAVEGTDLPDLTLIDLPGIVRLDEKMGSKIRVMIKRYIEKPETLILAVIPANVDIATSEALALAREVDPDHLRTLGVMTKADLVAKGEEHTLLKVLRNESYFLEKGYIAVKCRGQKAIQNNQTLKEALEEEQDFFANAEHFKELPCGTFGIPSLSVRLTDELVEHIQKLLPDLKNQAFIKRKETRDQLRRMGEGIPKEKSAKMEYLLAILNKYVEKLRRVAEGRETVDEPEMERLHIDSIQDAEISQTEDLVAEGRDTDDEDETEDEDEPQMNMMKTSVPFAEPEKTTLHNAAREAYKTFNVTIRTRYNTKVEDKRFRSEIERSLQRDRGYDLPHFSKFDTFKNIIVKIIGQFYDPSARCLETVSLHANKTLTSLAQETFFRFSLLEAKVLRLISQTLEDAKEKATKDIEKALRMELLVFAQDQYFNQMFDKYMKEQSRQSSQPEVSSSFSFGAKTAETSNKKLDAKKSGFAFTAAEPQALSVASLATGPQKEQRQVDTVLILTKTYMDIALKRISDNIPMIIRQNLMEDLISKLKHSVLFLIQDSGTLELLVEDRKTENRRRKLEESSDRLNRAAKELMNCETHI